MSCYSETGLLAGQVPGATFQMQNPKAWHDAVVAYVDTPRRLPWSREASCLPAGRMAKVVAERGRYQPQFAQSKERFPYHLASRCGMASHEMKATVTRM